MGVLFDYFTAASDADAAATIDRVGGPAHPAGSAQESARLGWSSRRPKGSGELPDGPAHATVADTGIDPVVQGGTLEELLTGRPYEEIEQDPRSGHPLAIRDGGGRLVLALTDGLVDALAQADSERLATVAGPWSRTEEFFGAGDPEVLTSLLQELSGLAREARSRGQTVYCWVCA